MEPPVHAGISGVERRLLVPAEGRDSHVMGFTLVAARVLGVLDDRYPELTRYLASLESRPAFRIAAET